MADTLDPEVRQLLSSQAAALKNIEELVDVSEGFRDTVRFVAHRVIGNHLTELFLYQTAQLSELGTGWNSSFENGNAQSDIRDDVMLDFITGMCGVPITIRLRGEEITLHKRGQREQCRKPFPTVTQDNRQDMARKLDEILHGWWN